MTHIRISRHHTKATRNGRNYAVFRLESVFEPCWGKEKKKGEEKRREGKVMMAGRVEEEGEQDDVTGRRGDLWGDGDKARAEEHRTMRCMHCLGIAVEYGVELGAAGIFVPGEAS